MNEPAPIFMNALNTLESLVEHETFFPGIIAHRHELRQAIQDLRTGVEDTNRPLRILLAGGTGVGKSTLLNALAGSEIAESGSIRPTTSHFTAYFHEEDSDPWIQALDSVKVVYHLRPALRHKVIIDAPDADSAVTENRKLLKDALKIADLVVVVATQEKYVSDAVLNLLADFRKGRRFVFVLNKIDAISEGLDDIREDMTRYIHGRGFPDAPVFFVSAMEALKRKEGGEAGAEGEFQALESFVSEQLTRMRIMEIRRLNLHERAELLADRISHLLGEGYETLWERWLNTMTEEIDTYVRNACQRLASTVLTTDYVAPVILACRTAGLSGLFGFFSGLVYSLKNVAGKHTPCPDSKEILNMLARRMFEMDFPTLDNDIKLLKGSLVSVTHRLELSEKSLDTEQISGVLTGEDKGLKWLARFSSQALDDRLKHQRRTFRKFVNLALNLPPWTWIGYWVYRLIESMPDSMPVMNAMPGAFLVLLLMLSVEWFLADALFAASSRRLAPKTITDILARVSARLKAELSAHPENVAKALATNTEKYSQSIGRLRSQR